MTTPSSAQDFLDLTLDLRAADPVRLNVIGSVATGVVQGRTYDAEHWFVVVDGEDRAIGAAVWTEPYRLLVGPMPDAAADVLAEHVAGLPTAPPGVIGPIEVAHRVASGLGRAATVRMNERILVLDRFLPVSGVRGSARSLTADDIDLAAEWMAQFAEDAGTLVPDARRTVEERAEVFRLWEVDGVPVALAGRAPLVATPTGTVARIGPVFTSRSHRGHGYGGAVTAAVVASVLDEADVVMIFTDASNPTSNGVYERLGFAVAHEIVDLDLA